MKNAEDVFRAQKSQILGVVRRTLAFIDRRLIDHGERVAYIAEAIARAAGDVDVDRKSLLILCLLHDIGAYKTEEINNMLEFETGDVKAHAAYGYVFLKNTTTLGAYVEALYDHHTDYNLLSHVDAPQKKAAALIFLADRIDILLATRGVGDWAPITELSGSAFSPLLVSAFLKAEKEWGISENVLNGAYRRAFDEQIESMRFSQEEIDSYIKMLVYSIDFRSPFTVTHTANTTFISRALADLLGLDEDEKHAVALGAFLHDVGKIAIPYSILENPGKLDADQMAKMRTHVSVSEEILSGIVSDDVCRIAVRHHEKLNGTGYPRGLTAPELTLPQRIVAVADIVSALINRRSYKEPFPKEKTVSIIASMRDAGELCPRVCDAFLGHYDEIVGELNRADDPVIRLYEAIKNEYRALTQKARANP